MSHGYYYIFLFVPFSNISMNLGGLYFVHTIAFISYPNLLCLVYICLADPEAIADGLKPLTISHTAKTISCKPIGTLKMTWGVEK